MNILVDIRAEEFLARLRGSTDRLQANIRRVVNRLSILVQARVKDKLTGQVLHVRTGTLRRSINRVVTENGSNITATIGTNVRYAAIHEYGFNGEVEVPAYTRKVRAQGEIALRKVRGRNFGVWEKKEGKVTGIANVREHTRRLMMPERSFLRSSLREYAPMIREELRKAAVEGVL